MRGQTRIFQTLWTSMAEGLSVKVLVRIIMRWPGRRLAPVAWEAPSAYEVAWEALLSVAWEALKMQWPGRRCYRWPGRRLMISGLGGAEYAVAWEALL